MTRSNDIHEVLAKISDDMKRMNRTFRPAFFRIFLEDAKHKDHPSASRGLLRLIAEDLEAGELAEEPRRWLIECLREAAQDGGSFDSAAGLKLRRGAKSQEGRLRDGGNRRLRDSLLAREVQSHVDAGVNAFRNSATKGKESACSIVAKKNGFKERLVEAAYTEWKKSQE